LKSTSQSISKHLQQWFPTWGPRSHGGSQGFTYCHCATDLEHLYRIYSILTHDKHQWLLLQCIVLLMMAAKGVRNMYIIPVVVNKHNTARVASCWFIIYYSILRCYEWLTTSSINRLVFVTEGITVFSDR